MRAVADTRIWVCALLLSGCGGDVIPKPRGYFRIDLPRKEYIAYRSECFSAEVPLTTRLIPRYMEGQRCWGDLDYGPYRAQVHLTYRTVEGDLGQLIQDAHDFKSKHESKAVRIRSERILNDSVQVYGTFFEVEGNVASPLVFYLTDSTSNFLYGALYFRTRPNADSLAPVTDRVREDMRHFARTLRWNHGTRAVQHAQEHR